MMVVCITGGIGSGKSIVCSVFQVLGVPVYDADAEAKRLYELSEIREAVKKEFGDKVFAASGEVNRKKLAELVFQNETELAKINRIVHPFVKERFRVWKKQYKEKAYILKEAAILFESGTNQGCGKIIVVAAPAELRLKRVMERDHRSEDQVRRIMQKQWPQEELVKRADFVIQNDGKKMVLPQVLEIHKALLSKQD